MASLVIFRRSRRGGGMGLILDSIKEDLEKLFTEEEIRKGDRSEARGSVLFIHFYLSG